MLGALTVSTRWLPPSAFAAFGIVFALALLLNAVNTLGIENHVALVSDEALPALVRVAMNALRLSCMMGVIAAGVTAFVSVDVACIILLAVLGGTAQGWYQLATFLALREERLSALSRGRLVQGLVNGSLILGFSPLALPGHVSLALAWIVSLCLGCSVLGASRLLRNTGGFWICTNDVRQTARVIGMQPLASLAAGLSLQSSLLVFPVILGTPAAGLWALHSRVIGGAVTFGVTVVGPAFYGPAARLAREKSWGELRRWHSRWLLLLVALSLGVPLLSIAMLRATASNPSWDSPERVPIAVACAVYFGVQLVTAPLTHTLLVAGQRRRHFLWEFGRLAVLLCALVGASATAADSDALWLWVAPATSAYVVHLVLQRQALRARAEPHAIASSGHGQ